MARGEVPGRVGVAKGVVEGLLAIFKAVAGGQGARSRAEDRARVEFRSDSEAV